MRNRVEITGINTSELKALSNEKTMELLELSHNGDDYARDELVYGNLLLVLSVIKKFTNRGENLDDLFQVGCLGLMKAIDNFDTSHGVRFYTYAVPMIIGEIRRYLRDNSPIRISRSLKDIAYKALKYKEEYLSLNHKEPTTKEISEYLQVEEVDVIVALEAIQEPISIYTPIYSNGSDEIFLIDQIKDDTNNEWVKINNYSFDYEYDDFKRLKKAKNYFKLETQEEISLTKEVKYYPNTKLLEEL